MWLEILGSSGRRSSFSPYPTIPPSLERVVNAFSFDGGKEKGEAFADLPSEQLTITTQDQGKLGSR
jgi:hypothetical protein